MRPSVVAVTMAVVMIVAAAGGSALAVSPTPASGSTWAPNQRIEYRWRAGDEPPAWMRTAINSAARDSNESRASRAAIFAYDGDGPAWIAYTGDLPTSWAVGYAVRYVPDYFTIRLRAQGYPLDWGTMRWCEFYDAPPTGCFNAEMITLHELGHAQTLGHVNDADYPDWTDSIMHEAPKSKAKVGWDANEYGRCDVARLQVRYQPLTPSTRYSTCLDLRTELSLTTSSSTATYYSYVTLTARLRVSSDADYPSLASDPVAGRRVILQRRVPGTTTWSTIVEMDADDLGRYERSVAVTATYEWRAFFATPSNEGLSGSASPAAIVRLTYDCAPAAARSARVVAQVPC